MSRRVSSSGQLTCLSRSFDIGLQPFLPHHEFPRLHPRSLTAISLRAKMSGRSKVTAEARVRIA
jgi:hypothetical protein